MDGGALFVSVEEKQTRTTATKPAEASKDSPFKSVFGGSKPAEGVSKPAEAPKESPFKSAFGGSKPAEGVSKPAEAPKESPFKSAFGGSKPAEAPKESPFKSAFGGSKPAEAPKESPFKSAFGGSKPAEAPKESPFKSAFGVSKPAEAPKESPFKSAFGVPKPAEGVSKPAEAPKESPFKSAFGVSKPAEAPKESPFKSAFGGSKPAEGVSKPAEAPKESPFKSAFGVSKPAEGVSKPAEAPKESPFKSAFGGSKPAEGVSKPAEAPKESPFKSAFGGSKPAEGVSKPAEAPKESPFKSSFGVSKPAEGPKESPFKSAFGGSKPAEAPKESPFKSAFGVSKPAEGVSKPAEAPKVSPFKSAFGGSKPAGAPKESPFKAFVFPSLPPVDAEQPPFFVGACPTSSVAALPAPVASPLNVMPRFGWRCAVCSKLKCLSGSHLEGKTEVRSECWPCAKKTLFRKVPLKEGEDANAPAQANGAIPACGTKQEEPSAKPPDATKSVIAGPKPDTQKESSFNTAVGGSAKSAFGTAKPFAVSSSSVSLSPPHAFPYGISATEFISPSLPPVDAEQPPFFVGAKRAFGGYKPAEAPKQSPFKAFVFPSLPSVDAEKPPFFVGACPTSSVAALPAPVASPLNVMPRFGWRCAVCSKLKCLSGSHLEGKTEVRSECWPCAKKTLFRKVPLKEGEDANSQAQGSPQANGAIPACKPPDATKSVIAGPKPDAQKESPLKNASAFGAAKPAMEDKQAGTAAAPKPAEAPKANTFRSAFGGAKPGDAPKESPFKSAFSTSRPSTEATQASTAAAPKPAEAPKANTFRSVFGGAKPGDAPKESPFKSAFSTSRPSTEAIQASTAAAPKPAEAPKANTFRSAFGGSKPGDAPKQSPFKSAFSTARPSTEAIQASTAAAPKPAEAPKANTFRSAFGGAKPGDAPKESPFKSAFSTAKPPTEAMQTGTGEGSSLSVSSNAHPTFPCEISTSKFIFPSLPSGDAEQPPFFVGACPAPLTVLDGGNECDAADDAQLSDGKLQRLLLEQFDRRVKRRVDEMMQRERAAALAEKEELKRQNAEWTKNEMEKLKKVHQCELDSQKTQRESQKSQHESELKRVEAELQTQLTTVQEENQKLIVENSQLMTNVQQLDAEVAKYKQQIAQLQKKNTDEAQNVLAQLQGLLPAVQKAVNDSTKEVLEVRVEEAAKGRTNELQQAVHKLEDESKKIKEETFRSLITNIVKGVGTGLNARNQNQQPEFAFEVNECIFRNAPSIALFREGMKKCNVPELLAVLKNQQAYSLAFHGTPDRNNVLSIFHDGWDPSKRSGQNYGPGEYFATEINTPLQYARQSGAVVIAILLPGTFQAAQNGYCVVNNPTDRSAAFCLPIGVCITNTQQPMYSGGGFCRPPQQQLAFQPPTIGACQKCCVQAAKTRKSATDNRQNCVFFVDEQGFSRWVPLDFPVNDLVECLSADPQSEFRFDWQPPNTKQKYHYLICDVAPHRDGMLKAIQVNEDTGTERELYIKMPNR